MKIFILLPVVLLLFLMVVSCEKKDEGPIYDPERDAAIQGEGDGLYDMESQTTPALADDDEEYISPFETRTSRSITWAPSLDVAKSLTKPGSGRKILMWFTNGSCSECRKIENNVFKHEKVLDQVSKYIWVRFDTDINPEMKEYYIQDNEPPALKWLDHEGNSYHQMYTDLDDPELVALHLRDFH